MNKELMKKGLDAANIKTRSQAGQNLSYIEGHYAIRTANEVFDYDGWDRMTDYKEIVQCEQKGDKWYVGYIAKVRVVADRTTREGTGFGQGVDKDLGRAHESAIKEAETDAMKRALMTFGDPFGLALYDKEQTHVEKGTEARKEPKAATPAKPRKGKADPTAPFGWLMPDILPGEWQHSTVSDKQYKYYQELLARHGVELAQAAAVRSMIVRSYGLDAQMVNKAGGYSFAIEFLLDASDDAIFNCIEATSKALAEVNGKKEPLEGDSLAQKVREVFEGATNGK